MNKPDRKYKVGDRVKVSMHGGRIVDGVIKAIVAKTDCLHYQVDIGTEQTALVRASQVVDE